MINVVLFHHSEFQPLWQQPGMIQCGPNMSNTNNSFYISTSSTLAIKNKLINFGVSSKSALIYYTDPFLLRFSALTELDSWNGPKVLVSGDLHHGPKPIETLKDYLRNESFDAILLAFNPAMIADVKSMIRVPVFSFPPTFFRYPSIKRADKIDNFLVHVGSIGKYHTQRRRVVEALLKLDNFRFKHFTTQTQLEASLLYSKHALALNIPLNNDLNHRFYEIMAVGCPQIIYGSPALLGSQDELGKRSDVFWASNVSEIVLIANHLMSDFKNLMQTPVLPPKQWEIKNLLKYTYQSMLSNVDYSFK